MNITHHKTAMDIVDAFSDELQSVLQTIPPISKAKMDCIKKAAIRGNKHYKHIVHAVEKFVSRCSSEYKLPALHVIDSIVRQSIHQFGAQRDVYVERFSRNLGITFEKVINDCLPNDRPKIIRILNNWQSKHIFSSKTLRPLLGMIEKPATKANANTSNHTRPKTIYDKIRGLEPDQQTTKVPRGHRSGNAEQYSSGRPNIYDYETENNINETPTEAEPLLSSTLSNIYREQEQARRMREEAISKALDQDHERMQLNGGRTSRSQSIVSENVDYEQLLIESKSHKYRSQTPSTQSPRSLRSSTPKSDSLKKQDRSLSQQSVSTACYPDKIIRQPELTHPVVEQDRALLETNRILERQRRCLPTCRPNHLTVCSSTLWIGHLPKAATESDISDVFGMFGTITSIDLIPPRGCAYVCMDRRQDASRVIQQSENIRMIKTKIKVAWAPGKGFKRYANLKDFWEADVGASFIPYERIDDMIQLEVLEDGGVIDEDSMNSELRQKRGATASSTSANDKSTPYGFSPPDIIPPALLLLQQQQMLQTALKMTSQAQVVSTPGSYNTLSCPPPCLTRREQLSDLTGLGYTLPTTVMSHDVAAQASMEQQMSMMYQATSSLPPPHLMLNSPYIQGLVTMQNQTNLHPFGLQQQSHMPNHISAQQQLVGPNHGVQTIGELSRMPSQELIDNIMFHNPHAVHFQHGKLHE